MQVGAGGGAHCDCMLGARAAAERRARRSLRLIRKRVDQRHAVLVRRGLRRLVRRTAPAATGSGRGRSLRAPRRDPASTSSTRARRRSTAAASASAISSRCASAAARARRRAPGGIARARSSGDSLPDRRSGTGSRPHGVAEAAALSRAITLAQLADQAHHPAMARGASLSSRRSERCARGALGLEPAMDLERAALELGEPCLQRRPRRGARAAQLGRRGLLGLGELPLHALELLGQRSAPSRSLALRRRPSRSVSSAALAFELDAAVLGLDAQLLLGVLALLGAPQLLLGRCAAIAARSGPLGLESGSAMRRASSSASRRRCCRLATWRLERLHRRLGGLRAADQRRVAGLRRAARAAFGEQVALGPAAAAFRTQPSGLCTCGRSAAGVSLPSAITMIRKLRCPPDVPGSPCGSASARGSSPRRGSACEPPREDRRGQQQRRDSRRGPAAARCARRRQPAPQIPLAPAPEHECRRACAVHRSPGRC